MNGFLGHFPVHVDLGAQFNRRELLVRVEALDWAFSQEVMKKGQQF